MVTGGCYQINVLEYGCGHGFLLKSTMILQNFKLDHYGLGIVEIAHPNESLGPSVQAALKRDTKIQAWANSGAGLDMKWPTSYQDWGVDHEASCVNCGVGEKQLKAVLN